MTTIDVSTYDSAEVLASDLEELVKEAAEVLAQDPDLEVSLQEEDGSFYLYWDAGPVGWAIDLLGGENVLGTALMGLRASSSLYVEAKTKQAIVVGSY